MIKTKKFGVVIKGIAANGEQKVKTLLRTFNIELTEKEFKSVMLNEINQKEYLENLKDVKLISINPITK